MLISREISKRTKINIIRTRVWPKIAYGCEAWSITREDEDRIRAVDMWVWRRLTNMRWNDFRSNDYVRRLAGAEDAHLIQAIKQRKSRYYGHVM